MTRRMPGDVKLRPNAQWPKSLEFCVSGTIRNGNALGSSNHEFCVHSRRRTRLDQCTSWGIGRQFPDCMGTSSLCNREV